MRFRSLISVVVIVALLSISVALYGQSASDDQAKAALDQANEVFATSDYKGALVAYQHVLEQYPGSSVVPAAMRGLGRCYSCSGDYDSAVKVDVDMLARYAEDTEAPNVALHLAHCYDMTKQWSKALDTFDMIATAYPASPVVPEAIYNAAQHYFGKGDCDSAIRKCSDLVNRFPNSSFAAGAQYKIGMLYIAKRPEGKSAEEKADFKNKADAAFAKLVEQYPNDKELCAKAELQRAGIAFERALDGVITWDAVVKQIQTVKEAYPDAPKAVLARLELMQAEKAFNSQDNSLALEHAESVISSYSDCRVELGWAHYLAGFASEQVNNIKGAIDHYSAVLSGNYTKADNFTDRDVTLYCLVRSGYCHAKQGEKDLATQAFQRVADAYPGTAQAKEAAAQLAKLKADRNVQK